MDRKVHFLSMKINVPGSVAHLSGYEQEYLGIAIS